MKIENSHTEFKEFWKDDYLKVIAAFANSNGGDLFIGISDDGRVVGIGNYKKFLEDIPNKVVQLLGITVDVELIKQNGKDILKIAVTPSSVPISFHGKYFIRSGSTVQELHGHELRDYILKKDNITWDEITIPQAQLEELDEKLIRRFITKAVNENRLYAEALNDDIQLTLGNLDLIKENGQLTRAAVLLFSKRPKKHIRTATVKIGRFGLTDTELISQDIIEGSVLEMPDKIIGILRTKYLHSPITYEGIERKERLEYPEKAVREAVLNAIVHRDYTEQTDITIRVYNDKIVFWNSGTLIAPLSIELLKQKHPSKRRNALIANIFFRIGFIEAWGRGILLITEEMKNAGMPEPIIEEYAGGFQITFLKANLQSMEKSVEKSVGKTVGKTVGKLLVFINENSKITREKMAEKTVLSIRGVEYNLNKLKKEGLIKRIGSAKGGHWEVIEGD